MPARLTRETRRPGRSVAVVRVAMWPYRKLKQKGACAAQDVQGAACRWPFSVTFGARRCLGSWPTVAQRRPSGTRAAGHGGVRNSAARDAQRVHRRPKLARSSNLARQCCASRSLDGRGTNAAAVGVRAVTCSGGSAVAAFDAAAARRISGSSFLRGVPGNKTATHHGTQRAGSTLPLPAGCARVYAAAVVARAGR